MKSPYLEPDTTGRLSSLRPFKKLAARTAVREVDPDAAAQPCGDATDASASAYRTYKRRWFGLAQLTLMNIVVSWDWLTFAPVSSDAASYYKVSMATINWISTAFFLAFVAVFPLAIIVIHRGPKPAIVVAALLMLVGNWIRYAGSTNPQRGYVTYVMIGEVLIGFAQPFILSAPTRYSDLWFSSKGRVAATALASLANPFGGAMGQLINPLWVTKPSDVSRMVLYVSIISTACCIPALFVPSRPPTPVGPSSETPKLRLRESARALTRSLELWLILIPFSVYVGLFGSCSSLINQMMIPYGFTDSEAGIGGAILITSGLVFAAIGSPILDRTKAFLPSLKFFVPLTALSYLVFIWMPETRTIVGPYLVLSALGISCFALVPVALEFLIELSHPLSPEVTSTTAWAGGQLLSAVFILIGTALTEGEDAVPPRNLKKTLIFHAVMAILVLPLPLCLGHFGRKDKLTLRRIKSDERGTNLQLSAMATD